VLHRRVPAAETRQPTTTTTTCKESSTTTTTDDGMRKKVTQIIELKKGTYYYREENSSFFSLSAQLSFFHSGKSRHYSGREGHITKLKRGCSSSVKQYDIYDGEIVVGSVQKDILIGQSFTLDIILFFTYVYPELTRACPDSQ
jgi:hypothetical protein